MTSPIGTLTVSYPAFYEQLQKLIDSHSRLKKITKTTKRYLVLLNIHAENLNDSRFHLYAGLFNLVKEHIQNIQKAKAEARSAITFSILQKASIEKSHDVHLRDRYYVNNIKDLIQSLDSLVTDLNTRCIGIVRYALAPQFTHVCKIQLELENERDDTFYQLLFKSAVANITDTYINYSKLARVREYEAQIESFNSTLKACGYGLITHL